MGRLSKFQMRETVLLFLDVVTTLYYKIFNTITIKNKIEWVMHYFKSFFLNLSLLKKNPIC